nr:G-type lectin S-receptor-like serine/threonine-protein kinase CES101 [Tanacetum cinerariifolium]
MAGESTFFVIVLIFFYCNNPCYSETDTLHQGQQLKDWDYLVSSNRIFSLKFFGFGTTISPYLGVFYNGKYNDGYYRYLDNYVNNRNKIRYRYTDGYCPYLDNYVNNRNKINNRYTDDYRNSAVWVANRNNPIPDTYGKLMIDVHGKLSLLSREATVLDLFSPTLVKRNASVTLLDSGNLVLQELFPDGSQKKVLWQSFDYPTDTLLPGMKLGINRKTGHRWSLTSWRSEQLPADGSFTLTGDLNGTDQMVILRRGNTHWLSGPWQNGQFKNTDLESSGSDVRLYYVSNETEQSFAYLTKTYDSLPALRMLMDGRLMGTTLKLDVHCHLINDHPGCAENEFENFHCRKDYYYSTSNGYSSYNKYVDEYVYDESYNLTFYDCIKICWSNCSCVACTYATKNKAGCKTYAQKTYTGSSESQEEYFTVEYRGEIKIEKKSKAWNPWIGVIVMIVMIVPLVLLLSCYWAYKKLKLDVRGKAKKIKKLLLHQMRRFYNYVRRDKNFNAEVHYFTFQSISSATSSFSNTNKLGEGGFGAVYKGKLADGQEVAVKRLSKSSGQGIKEFKNETELIAKLQHTNLVKLIGCCVEKQEKILVYEYMPNNSLDFFLFDPSKKGLLDWNNRFVIIDGIAQGLLYLHRFSRLRVIHRDLKASNILLDDYLKPKISDFGMAKLFGNNESEANTSRVVGTRGYMPPEYLIEGTVSTKIDVFGFGVLLLEIISSKMNHGSYDAEHPLNLLGLAWELWNEGRGLELMDPTLEDSCTPKEVMTCIHVGLLCVQDHAMDRPTMSEVVSMLTNENMHLPEPKQPAFFIERSAPQAPRDDSLGKGSSVNGQSISIVVAR